MTARASLTLSLPALRTFEAVARLGGLTAAADELGLTVSAISHQLRGLEGAIGLSLLRRHGRGVALTERGAAFAAELEQAFADIDVAVDRLRSARPTLTVTVQPSFAARWLMPRLHRFDAIAPGVDLRLSTTPRLVELGRERIDRLGLHKRATSIVARFGQGQSQMHIDKLVKRVFPRRGVQHVSGKRNVKRINAKQLGIRKRRLMSRVRRIQLTQNGLDIKRGERALLRQAAEHRKGLVAFEQCGFAVDGGRKRYPGLEKRFLSWADDCHAYALALDYRLVYQLNSIGSLDGIDDLDRGRGSG